MGKLLPHIHKELLLLIRDYAGLLVIFLMPVVLVVVVTLVQQNVLKSLGATKVRILFLDRDRQIVGPAMEKALRESGSLEVTTRLNNRSIEPEAARAAVAKGDFQFAVVIPEGMSEAVVAGAKEAAGNSLSVDGKKSLPPRGKMVPPSRMIVYFDPTLRDIIRDGVANSLEKAIFGIEADEKMKAFSALLPREVEAAAKKAMGSMWSEEYRKAVPTVHIAWDKRTIITLEEKTAQYENIARTPTTVQQNVPAWTLFGMFFVVIPLGGSLIRERQNGMLVRLLTMPVSSLTILAGKICAYALICMAQFGLILAVGKLLLPLLGTPVLEMGSSPAALIIVALSASLAACGWGILLGTIARTYEQSSGFGAVSVVIAAAIGGIMAPVYAMPQVMQKISVLSPLSWGLNGFLDVFVRGGNVQSVLPDAGRLLVFFVATTLIAWFNLSRKGAYPHSAKQ